MEITQMLSNLKNLLGFKSVKSQSIPTPLVLAASSRTGISETRVYNKMVEHMKKLDIPVGNLPDGSPNPNAILIYLLIQEIYNDIRENAKIQVAIEPFGNVTATGTDAIGIPVVTNGVVTTIQTGGAVIS
jgi:hypothetical protein